jgi:group I intron endonuclease
MNTIAGIYKIINLINNKCYIGKSNNILLRLKDHKRHINSLPYSLYRAIRKYKIENFSFEIIELIERNTNKKLNKELLSREKYYIKKFKSHSKLGYNMTDGGEGIVGFHHSKETKIKCSESQQGEKSVWYGKKHTEETKQKQSKTALKRYADIRKNNNGKSFLKEHCENISKGLIGIKRSEEVRRNISEGHKGLYLSGNFKSHNVKSVICLETQEIFSSINEASRKYGNLSNTTLSKCCQNKGITCGGYHWKFYNDWILLTTEKQQNILNNLIRGKTNCRKVICLTTNEIFNSLTEAGNKYKISHGNISLCCQHKKKYTSYKKEDKIIKLEWCYA